MGKKTVSGIMLTLLLIGMLILASDIQPVKASGTIYIRSDGSVDPDTAPISTVDNVTYIFTDNIYEGVSVQRSSIIIDGDGYTLQGAGSGSGFWLSHVNNVTIKRTIIIGFDCGIELWDFCCNNKISGNNITQNNQCGIQLDRGSHYNTISGNSITNNGDGIALLRESFSNTISGNSITNNGDGIALLGYSFSNTISGNNITNNGDGVWLFEYSSSNTISNNNITQNHRGIWGNWGAFSNTISGNRITNNQYGILLDRGSLWLPTNTISGNSIMNNVLGIYLQSSFSNTISGNSITNNGYGVWLFEFSSSNTISNNNITQNNCCGIWLAISNNNSVSENDIIENAEYGIFLEGSSYNTIYHNNFVNNGEQVISFGRTNFWDDGYPSGGNYWSDYSIRYPTVVDDYHGENQDILGSDGVWDSPYFIEVGSKDNYPFVNPLDMIPPVADAGPDIIVHEDIPVTLNGEASSDNVGIVSYVWTFTDVTPQTLTGVNPTYAFQTPGIYIVTLNVTDARGNWDTDDVVITVVDVTSPVADAGSDQTADEDTLVTLEGWRSTDNVGITCWTWAFTDVTPQTLTGENVTYTFATPGTYTVTLNVSDAAGNWDTDTVVITVLKMTPEELLQRLMETIESWNLGSGTENSLTSKLEDAFHLLDIGNENGAIHKLTDFINQVEALRGMKLTIEQADYLTAEAQRIIDRIKG